MDAETDQKRRIEYFEFASIRNEMEGASFSSFYGWTLVFSHTATAKLLRFKTKGTTICWMGIGTEPELYSKNFIRCSGVNCLRTSTSLPRVSNTRALFVARCVVNSWMCLSFSAILKNPREHDAPHSLLTHKETRNRCNNEEIIHLRYQKHLHAALFVVLVHRARCDP